MFLSRPQEKIMCGKAEMNSSSSADVRGLSVDLTMGVPGSATSRVFAPTSVEFLPLASAALPDSINVNTVLTSSVSADAEQADPSCSQSGSMRNFDMNRLPSGAYEECGNYGTASSAVSIVSPFLSDVVIQNSKRDVIAWDGETGSKIHEEGINYISLTNNSSDHEDEEGDAAAGAPGGPPRKKLRLSKEQSALLEESFREHHTLNPKQKDALAKQLSLRSRQVEVWFQNRRARTKLKQTEVDCDFLKRCCESLTEENRRLQREVEELRAIKVAPPCVIAQDFYMPLPAATLTMCPSCERMGSTIDKRALTFTKPSYYLTNFRQPSAAC